MDDTWNQAMQSLRVIHANPRNSCAEQRMWARRDAGERNWETGEYEGVKGRWKIYSSSDFEGSAVDQRERVLENEPKTKILSGRLVVIEMAFAAVYAVAHAARRPTKGVTLLADNFHEGGWKKGQRKRRSKVSHRDRLCLGLWTYAKQSRACRKHARREQMIFPGQTPQLTRGDRLLYRVSEESLEKKTRLTGDRVHNIWNMSAVTPDATVETRCRSNRFSWRSNDYILNWDGSYIRQYSIYKLAITNLTISSALRCRLRYFFKGIFSWHDCFLEGIYAVLKCLWTCECLMKK